MSTPVVTVATGGIPVVELAAGAFGLPVTRGGERSRHRLSPRWSASRTASRVRCSWDSYFPTALHWAVGAVEWKPYRGARDAR
jgi:hypothetical protein